MNSPPTRWIASVTCAGTSFCVGADDGANICSLQTIDDVVWRQHVGNRHHHGADLMQRDDGEPVFVVTLERQHHAVTAFHAGSQQHIGDAIASGD